MKRGSVVLAIHNLEAIRNDQVMFSAVNFTLSAGEVLHISGANGCGKSTLLQMLIGLLLPAQGEVLWGGVPIGDCTTNYQSQLVYIGHKIGVKNNLTVSENLRLIAKLHTSYSNLNWQRVLQQFKLHELQHTLCGHLSAGQRQRVALARLLIQDALLWILDEPFTAIDSNSIILLQELIGKHVQKGGMVVITSHQPLMLRGVKQLLLDDSQHHSVI